MNDTAKAIDPNHPLDDTQLRQYILARLGGTRDVDKIVGIAKQSLEQHQATALLDENTGAKSVSAIPAETITNICTRMRNELEEFFKNHSNLYFPTEQLILSTPSASSNTNVTTIHSIQGMVIKEFINGQNTGSNKPEDYSFMSPMLSLAATLGIEIEKIIKDIKPENRTLKKLESLSVSQPLRLVMNHQEALTSLNGNFTSHLHTSADVTAENGAGTSLQAAVTPSQVVPEAPFVVEQSVRDYFHKHFLIESAEDKEKLEKFIIDFGLTHDPKRIEAIIGSTLQDAKMAERANGSASEIKSAILNTVTDYMAESGTPLVTSNPPVAENAKYTQGIKTLPLMVREFVGTRSHERERSAGVKQEELLLTLQTSTKRMSERCETLLVKNPAEVVKVKESGPAAIVEKTSNQDVLRELKRQLQNRKESYTELLNKNREVVPTYRELMHRIEDQKKLFEEKCVQLEQAGFDTTHLRKKLDPEQEFPLVDSEILKPFPSRKELETKAEAEAKALTEEQLIADVRAELDNFRKRAAQVNEINISITSYSEDLLAYGKDLAKTMEKMEERLNFKEKDAPARTSTTIIKTEKTSISNPKTLIGAAAMLITGLAAGTWCCLASIFGVNTKKKDENGKETDGFSGFTQAATAVLALALTIGGTVGGFRALTSKRGENQSFINWMVKGNPGGKQM